MKPSQPKNEKRRLEVLWDYGVLDTSAESSFDDLAGLAAEICNAPMASITFVDEHRQWFKAKVGLTATETSRDVSFCGHAILNSNLMIVPDAAKDPRFDKNPLVTGEPKIRFYAGAPLIDSEGNALGTICVLDKVPRELSPSQKHSLQILSRHVVALLELRRKSTPETRRMVKGKYQKIFDNALVGIFRTSREGKYLEANPAIAQILGYDSPQEMVGAFKNIAQELYVDPNRLKVLQELLEAHGSVHDFQAQYFRKDGSKVWVKLAAQVVRDDAGKFLYYEGVIQDISAQISAESQLRQSEMQYRTLFEGNPHPMWVFDQETSRFLEVNDAAVIHYGFSREEFQTMTLADIRPPEDIPALTDYHNNVLSGKWRTGLLDTNVWRHRKKDGTVIEVEIKWTTIEFQGRKAQLVLAHDITERRRTEFQNATFSRLGHSLSSASSVEEAARIIARAADKLLGWDACSMDLCSPDEHTIQPILNIDIIEGRKVDVPAAYKTGPPSTRVAQVIKNGGQIILRNEPDSPRESDLRSFGNTGRPSASLLFVPIHNVKKVIGVLSIQSYTINAYNSRSLEILQALADQCGGAIERITAEQNLAEERNLLRTLLDHLPDYIFVKDLHSHHILSNKAHEQLIGSSEARPDRIPKEIATQHLRDDQQVFQTGETLMNREEQTVDAEGNCHSLLTTKVPLRDANGNMMGLVGISRDVTQSKRTESTLRETKEMFDLISKNVSDLIAVLDASGNRLYNSPSYKQIFGDPKALRGTDSFAQIHPDDQEHVREIFAETIRTGIGRRIEYRFLLPDGTIRYIESQGNFVRGETIESSKVVVVSRDITERKNIEDRQAALSDLGQRLSAATSPQEAARVLGETTRQLFGWDVFTLDLYFADTNFVQPILNVDTLDGEMVEVSSTIPVGPPGPLTQAVLDKGAILILKQPPLTMTQGSVPFGDVSRPSASMMLVPIRNGTKMVGMLSNQSYSLNAYSQSDLNALQTIADHCGGALERIRAEEALRTSEIRFHSVWENSVDGMRLTNENGIVVAVNKAFCDLVQMERADLIGQSFTVTYAVSENHADILNKYKKRFQNHTFAKLLSRRMTFHSGKVAELECANSFVDLGSNRPLLLVLFRDVTEQKRLETLLRQSQKMDSIGQLAGGIAHDFNNLLTVIQGHTSLLLATETKDSATDSLQQISLAAERSANLTRQLLTFSRRQIMQRHSLDFKEIVDEMTKMLRRILGEDITLKVENGSNLPLIHADRGMMEQILMNLAVNSRDAMPRGGELIITTNAVRIDETHTRKIPDAYLGEFICLTVRDTGSGILPEIMGHIFEPFFTTKEIGKGTGLGLATVYGIVKQHEGWIEVLSEVGKGTEFKIYFPQSHQASEISGKSSEENLLRGHETILVVEDESPLRELVVFLLERQGYTVLEAASGVAAVKVWEKQKDKIDLLLTDLVMPEGMTGGDLSKILLAENPNLKVIYTSGYSADIVGKDFILRDGLNFLQKPYHPDKLARTVRDCLDGK